MNDTETQWLIWSMEHTAWWSPDRNGYTRLRANAGRYSESEAKEIVLGGNMGAPPDRPHEAMIYDNSKQPQPNEHH